MVWDWDDPDEETTTEDPDEETEVVYYAADPVGGDDTVVEDPEDLPGQFSRLAGLYISKILRIGPNGVIFQGTGTPASPTTALKIYNSGGVGLFEMWIGGNKVVWLDDVGLGLRGESGTNSESVTWWRSGYPTGILNISYNAGYPMIEGVYKVEAPSAAESASIALNAQAGVDAGVWAGHIVVFQHKDTAASSYIQFGLNLVDYMILTGAGQLQLVTIGSSAGILIGGDAQLFRGAANRLDLASGDSLNLVNGSITLAGANGAFILGSSVLLTIASGVITVTRTAHAVDTEGGAATDDLETINGGTAGQLLILSCQSNARAVTVKDNTGNLRLAGDCVLDNIFDNIVLIYQGTNWREVSRSNNV